MARTTTIAWTDATWNPVYGCRKTSDGCLNCYAERYGTRFRAGVPFTTITLNEHKISEPITWRRGRKVFVCSLSDLFHPGIPTVYRDRIFATMLMANQHIYQVLTKRPGNAIAYFDYLGRRPSPVGTVMNTVHEALRSGPINPMDLQIPTPAAWARFFPLPNVWIGVSVENRFSAGRIQDLLKIPAVLRFVSFEPLLGPIAGSVITSGIGWIIVGGETGPRSRAMATDWPRPLFDAARRRGIPAFMKQMGGYPKKRDTIADFPVDLRVQQFPALKRGDSVV